MAYTSVLHVAPARAHAPSRVGMAALAEVVLPTDRSSMNANCSAVPRPSASTAACKHPHLVSAPCGLHQAGRRRRAAASAQVEHAKLSAPFGWVPCCATAGGPPRSCRLRREANQGGRRCTPSDAWYRRSLQVRGAGRSIGRAMRCACPLGGLAKGAEEPRTSLACLARGTPQRRARRFARLANLPIEVSRTLQPRRRRASARAAL